MLTTKEQIKLKRKELMERPKHIKKELDTPTEAFKFSTDGFDVPKIYPAKDRLTQLQQRDAKNLEKAKELIEQINSCIKNQQKESKECIFEGHKISSKDDAINLLHSTKFNSFQEQAWNGYREHQDMNNISDTLETSLKAIVRPTSNGKLPVFEITQGHLKMRDMYIHYKKAECVELKEEKLLDRKDCEESIFKINYDSSDYSDSVKSDYCYHLAKDCHYLGVSSDYFPEGTVINY